MAKIFGVLLIVLGVWIGMEIYTKGMHDAFGGVFARFAEPLDRDRAAAAHGSLAERAGIKVKNELDDAARRENEAGAGEDGD